MTRRRQEGITLLECLIYVACLSLLANVLFPVFMDATRLSVYGNAAADRLRSVTEFREVFTQTVHEATQVVDVAGIYRTGSDQIVLGLTPDMNGAKRYAVIGAVPNEPKLQCLNLFEENGALVLERCRLFALHTTSVNVIHVQTPGNLSQITFDISLLNAAGKKDKPPVPYRFESVMRASKGVQ